MITSLISGTSNFINLSAALVNAAGVRVDPTSAIATVFQVDQTTGTLVRDTTFGPNGQVTLVQQAGEVGFWGASLVNRKGRLQKQVTEVEAELVELNDVIQQLK